MREVQTDRYVAAGSDGPLCSPHNPPSAFLLTMCCSSTTIVAFMILNLTPLKQPSVVSKLPLAAEVVHRSDRKVRLWYPSSVQNLSNHSL